jgi:hypothetical protein
MSKKNPRENLGFVEGVTELFRFLETDYGYQQSHRAPTLVVYETRELEVQIRHGLLSYEVEFNISRRKGRLKWRYDLPEILCALAPEYRGSTFYQTTKRDLLRQSLASIAELIRKYADPLLRGSDAAVRLVEMAHQEGSRRTTEYYTIRPVKEKADAAWKSRNYREVVALYISVESHLDPLERRRLEYAKKHVSG